MTEAAWTGAVKKQRTTSSLSMLALVGLLVGCERRDSATAEFTALMQTLARAWSTQDTDLALSVFAVDAVYMEPPDVQLYRGHEQLRPYFDALTPGTTMQFHNLFYNPQTAIGGGEYVFGHRESEQADVGVAVVRIEEKLIVFWREYQRKGPADFSAFLATEGKQWRWHIGNYP